tara:strand:- start:141 stop:854 length:714 start_codon:yes stop_codon:yes gene_type:complete
MGGRFGDGPIPIKLKKGKFKDNEPVFKFNWHAKALAITLATASVGKWSIDKGRFFRECLPPIDYNRFSYYEKWISALTNLLIQKKLINTEELKNTVKEVQSNKNFSPKKKKQDHQDILRPQDVSLTLGRGGPSKRKNLNNPKFKIGDKVKTLNYSPNIFKIGGHTRLPMYARGKLGKILLHHQSHVLPDKSAHELGDGQEHLYTVEFKSNELWGKTNGNANDLICIDLWESYLIYVA